MSGDPETPPEAPSLVSLLPPGGRAHWRFTGIVVALLLLLAAFKVATARPPTAPSHRTPQAAVTGYLAALASDRLPGVQAYLAPSQRGRAEAMLAALRSRHVKLVAPAVGPAEEGDSSASVGLTLQVCYRSSSARPYTCKPLRQAPLGLPTYIRCVRRDGQWYVATLFLPQAVTAG